MQNQIIQSSKAKKVITLARERHWRFRHIGNDGMINTPTFDDDWLKIPIEEDSSIIPKRALMRARFVEESGFKTQGLIVAHEAPKLLAAPKVERKPIDIPVKEIALVVLTLTEAFVMMAGAFGYALISLDPALIVVLDSGEQIEVMSWYE